MIQNTGPARQEWVSRVLGFHARAGGAATTDETAPLQGTVAYRKALLAFAAARADASAQLAALRREIEATLPEEAELAARVAAAINAQCDEIGDAVDAALNAASSERAELNAAAQRRLTEFADEIEADPLIDHVDANPFVVTEVRATLTKALAHIVDTMV
jgi:aminopeptidase N